MRTMCVGLRAKKGETNEPREEKGFARQKANVPRPTATDTGGDTIALQLLAHQVKRVGRCEALRFLRTS